MADRRLKPLQITRERRSGMYADGGGLYLQVTSKDGVLYRSWLFRYRFNGHVSRNGKPLSREMGLGSHRDFSLAEARERARAQRQLIADGIDPIAERDRRRREAAGERARSKTFPECADAYVKAHGSGWKNPKHRKQWRKRLTDYADSVFGSTPVSEIDVSLVMKVLEPIWHQKTETATRVRGYIEKVLDWAKVAKYRQGDNPARWKGNLDQLLLRPTKVRKVKHHPALPYAEIGTFVFDLRSREGIAARALELAILCAVRTGDIIGGNRENSDDKPPMKWSHVDLDAEQVWTIPSTKTETEHRVPLSGPVVRLLKEVKALGLSGDVVFSGRAGEPLSNMAMEQVIRRMNADRTKRGDPRYVDPKQGNREIVPHGFRSSFKDWAAEQTNFPRELAEKALAHAVGDETERAYQRGDMLARRRKLMEAWAAHCARSSANQSAKVISLRA